MPSRHTQTDPHILFWLALAASVSVAPFVLFHLLSGQWLMLLVTASTQLVLLAVALEVWRTQQVARRHLVGFGMVATAAVLLTAYRLGPAGVLWAYPMVIFLYYMLGTRLASMIALVLCPGVVWLAAGVEETLFVRIVASIGLTWALSFIFSINIERQRRQMADLALRDPLTGVLNRREMQAELLHAVHLKERYGTCFSLVTLDIDHFKRINDTFGHGTGDQVLIALCARVSERLRQSDQLFRLGGEEFVILLPETEPAQAELLAVDLAERLRASPLGGIDGITASFGVAELQTGESIESWLERADAALYHAKRQGRDRVEVASEGMTEVVN